MGTYKLVKDIINVMMDEKCHAQSKESATPIVIVCLW